MTSLGPPMKPARVFASPEHRHAAAAIVATVNVAVGLHATRRDTDAVAGVYADVATLDPLTVVAAASVIVAKLIHDEHTVWLVNPWTTIARMGQWVAADEVA